MQRYKCRDCAFAFSEADSSWDSAIDSGRCPKCSEPLYAFPVPVKSQHHNVAKVGEEDMYAAALSELQSGTARPGLWAKAFVEAKGDENKSKALYIKLRVQQEKDSARPAAAPITRVARSWLIWVLSIITILLVFVVGKVLGKLLYGLLSAWLRGV